MIYSKRKPQDKYSDEKGKMALDYLIKTGQFTDDELEAELVTLIIGVRKY